MKKKNIFSILLDLMLLGFMAKALSMVARVLMNRTLSVEAMSLYTLASPAMVLIITLAQMGIPTTIATLISKNPTKSKKIFLSALLLCTTISLFFMVITIIFTPFLADNVLHNKEVTMTLYALALLAPLVSLSSLLKGYYIGHNLVKMTARSSIVEEIARIIFILFFLNYFASKGNEYAAFGAMIGVCIGEVFQTLYLLTESNLQLYKRINELFDIKDLSPLKEIPGILSLSLPITLGRIVGSLTYFLEPIIATNLMIKAGYLIENITLEYGILNGYAMPILLLPGFFSSSLANYLLPNMTRYSEQKQFYKAKKIFFFITSVSLSIGLIMALIFFFGGDKILYLLYKTDKGASYIHYLSFPFILYYIEAPLASAMHALEMTKKVFFTTVISSIVRIISLLILVPKLGINAIAISTLIEILVTIIINAYHVLMFFFSKTKKSAIRL